jgi:hypothetical protein
MTKTQTRWIHLRLKTAMAWWTLLEEEMGQQKCHLRRRSRRLFVQVEVDKSFYLTAEERHRIAGRRRGRSRSRRI